MLSAKISEKFENGIIAGLSKDIKTETIDWNEHNLFKGVYLLESSKFNPNLAK